MSEDPTRKTSTDVYYLKKSSNQSIIYTSVKGIMEPAKTLIDSGSSRNLIDQDYMKQKNITTTELSIKKSVIAIDGREIRDAISKETELNIEVEGKAMKCKLSLQVRARAPVEGLTPRIPGAGAGIQQNSCATSLMAAPCFYVNKADGGLRLVVDYRKLNTITKPFQFPMPVQTELPEQLKGAKIFTKMDVRWGFNNIESAKGMNGRQPSDPS
ncbi:Transposon Tf2-1 polyprotein [Ceratobasidium sp. AG-Ba]|nr:Transposon Tf2-1 polyprotein [Ceratobasidium sp. AG-Ba]